MHFFTSNQCVLLVSILGECTTIHRKQFRHINDHWFFIITGTIGKRWKENLLRDMHIQASKIYLVSIVVFQVVMYQIDDFYYTLAVRFCYYPMLEDAVIALQPYLFEEKNERYIVHLRVKSTLN